MEVAFGKALHSRSDSGASLVEDSAPSLSVIGC